MQKRRSVLFRWLLLGLGLLSAGCPGKAQSTADAGPPKVNVASLTPEQSAQVLVRVGDKAITLGEFAATLEQMDQFDRLRYQSPERRKELLEEMVQIELLAQEAAATNVGDDRERRAVLREALLAQARKGSPTPNEIPEPDVRAYYEAHRAEYRDPERRRVSAIVLRDEATARAVLASVKDASAVVWGETVRKKSVDGGAKANVPVDLAGDLGMVSPPGDPRGYNARIPAEVRTALFEIGKVGEVYAKPVVSGGKAYLVRLTQKAEAHERSFAEAERTIRIKLAQDRIRAKEEELVQSLRTRFPVRIDEDALKAVAMPEKRN